MDAAYYNEALRISAKSVGAAGLIFLACMMLGSPPWKALVAGSIILLAHRAGIGRKYAEFFAVAAIIVALIVWTEIIPQRFLS